MVVPVVISGSESVPMTEKRMGTSSVISELRISSISVNRNGDAVSFTIELSTDGHVAAKIWASRYGQVREQGAEVSDSNQTTTAETQLTTGSQSGAGALHLSQWWPDTRIYVYHFANDKLQYFDFTAVHHHMHWLQYPSGAVSVTGWWPRHHSWDQYDARLLAVEAAPIETAHPVFSILSTDDGELEDGGVLSKPKIIEQFAVKASSPVNVVNRTDGVASQGSRSSSRLAPRSEHIRCIKNSKEAPTLIVSMFAGSEQTSPIVQESYPMAWHHSKFIGLEVPYFYFAVRCDLVYRLISEQTQRERQLAKSGRHLVSHSAGAELNKALTTLGEACSSGDKLSDTTTPDKNETTNMTASVNNHNIHYINRRVMRDFVDLEHADSGTREAILAFSYYLTMGEMDAAFKAMKLIKSPAVWQ
ncbi:unnamed protein product, partial [Dicrocoelium dendriticum]